MGDIEGFKRCQKVYDSLMKSGKFTAQQNKEDGEFVTAIGACEICEKEGFIPDIILISQMIKLMKLWLIWKVILKLGLWRIKFLGNLIEQSIKTMMNEENKEEDEDIEEEIMT